MAASELKSNISNTNWQKQKKLFLYFVTSHTNQTNKIFHLLLTSTQNLKKTD